MAKKNKETTVESALSGISLKRFNTILDEAPETVQSASEELKNAYVAYEYAENLASISKYRYYSFTTKRGEDVDIDLKNNNYKTFIRKKLGSEDDVDRATVQREIYYDPLLQKAREAKKIYDTIYKEEMSSSVPADVMSYIVKLFGEMNGVDDVQKIIKEEKGIRLTQKELQSIFSKKKPEIEAKRATFLASSNEFKIATEAGRLQIINSIIVDLQRRYQKYLDQEKEEKALVFEKEIRNMLEQARKEVKGNELKLTVDGKIDITATMHGQENISRVFRTLPVNSIIVGLVAAKSGLDPTVLVHQLATSYYKDFNGFNKTILGREKIMLPGDLIRAANWDDLERQNSRFLDEMKPYEVQEATFVEEEVKESVKERLRSLRMK